MTLLIALALVVHGAIHIGYPCGPAWPFDATDPWPVALLGVAPGSIHDAGVVLAVVTFVAFLLAAVTAIGLLPSTMWRPSVLLGVGASGVMLVVFVTPWTLPGLAIDSVLAWAILVRHWAPARRPVVGRRVALP